MSGRSSEEGVEALIHLLNRDVLLLGYLSYHCSIIATHCVGILESILTSRSVKRADDVLTDSAVDSLIAYVDLVVAGYVAGLALGEGRSCGGQHHGQHRCQRHYLPQLITSQ